MMQMTRPLASVAEVRAAKVIRFLANQTFSRTSSWSGRILFCFDFSADF
jgi:hypothetical protein